MQYGGREWNRDYNLLIDKLLDPHTCVILFKYLIKDINLFIIWIFVPSFKENVEIIIEKYICANSPMGESSP